MKASPSTLLAQLTLSMALVTVFHQAKADNPTSASMVTIQQAPDVFIRQLTDQILQAVRTDKSVQSGDIRKVEALVNSKILPHLNFEKMTATAVGKYWAQATPAQQKRLQQEFKTLLLYTYSGAVTQIRDQTVDVKPTRSDPDAQRVIVKTLVRGQGEPVQLDYRLQKTPEGWKIEDVNVLGAWLVQNYKSSFSQDIATRGLDGLITSLTLRNQSLAEKKSGG